MAPGIDGLLRTGGAIYGKFTGQHVAPYIPPNMGAYDAHLANYNTHALSNLNTLIHTQFAQQLGNTVGGLGFIEHLASMTGYSAADTRSVISGGAAAFGRSMFGSIAIPMLDTMFARAGLTGGSFIASATAAYANRVNLLSPGTVLRPYDGVQQHSAMAATSAFLTLANGLMSGRTPQGTMSLLPNMQFTQGLDRGTITDILMKAAGSGAFTTNVVGPGGVSRMGFADRMSEAAGGTSLTSLSFDDMRGTGSNSTARLKQLTEEFSATSKSIVDAFSAMRDLLNTVDGVSEKLTTLTGGGWLSRAGGASAASAVRRLHAVTQQYNIDPTGAMDLLMTNRSVLQQAAGITPDLQAMGFSGGGMFGLGAQTALLSSVEDMITSRGARGNPILEGRYRLQGLQAMSRNMNTTAGLATQALAWGRQLGVISEADSAIYHSQITSGDRSVVGAGINRLLTTLFGSAQVGLERMNDSMFVNSMRQSMNDKAGEYATTAIILGADSEFMRQNSITAASSRLDFATGILAGSGMSTVASESDVAAQLQSVEAALGNGSDGATALRAAYNNHKARGARSQTALSLAVRSVKSNPAFSQYGERMDLALTRSGAANREAAILADGGKSAQASAVLSALQGSGAITGSAASAYRRRIRAGDGAGVLGELQGVAARGGAGISALAEGASSEAARRYDSHRNGILDRRVVEDMLSTSGANGYGAEAVAAALEQLSSAAAAYNAGELDATGLSRAALSSNYGQIFGAEAYGAMRAQLLGGGTDYASRLGRMAVIARQQGTKTLGDLGYTLGMSRYWGDGTYAGSSKGMFDAMNQLAATAAGLMQESSVKDADFRATLAQRLFKAFSGGGLEAALAIDTLPPEMRSRISNLKTLTDRLGAAHGDYLYRGGAVQDAAAVLDARGGAGVADAQWLSKTMSSGSAIDIGKFRSRLAGMGLDEAMQARVVEAAEAHNTRVEAQKAVSAGVSVLAGEDGAAGLAAVVEDIKRIASSESAAANGGFSYLDQITVLPQSSLYGGKGARYDKVQEILNKAAPRGEIVPKLGGTAHDTAVMRKQLDTIKAGAKAGDLNMIKAAEELRVETTRGSQRIHGEIVIRSGNETRPATVEGFLGGLGE